MSRTGKKEGKRPEGEVPRKKSAAKVVLPPPPEEPSGKSKLMNAAVTVALLALVGLVVWKKFNPEPPIAQDKHVPIEVETPWTSAVDGKRALDFATTLCAIGPRVSGTEGAKAARELIKAELAAAGITDIRPQTFTEETPKGPVEFTNLIAVLPGKRPEAIALAAHYDSKPFDEFRFVGANDAASAVGLLVELARTLKAEKPERDLTTLFFFIDGEEAFNKDWGDQAAGAPDHTYGSRYLASKLKDFPPLKTLILLDIIGEKDISFVDDANSDFALRDLFKQTSKEVFGVNFLRQQNQAIQDDHVPFREAGVPVIDLIDFEYGIGPGSGPLGYWHTADDTVDKLDRRGFDVTGTLVLKAFPKVEKRVLKGL